MRAEMVLEMHLTPEQIKAFKDIKTIDRDAKINGFSKDGVTILTKIKRNRYEWEEHAVAWDGKVTIKPWNPPRTRLNDEKMTVEEILRLEG